MGPALPHSAEGAPPDIPFTPRQQGEAARAAGQPAAAAAAALEAGLEALPPASTHTPAAAAVPLEGQEGLGSGTALPAAPAASDTASQAGAEKGECVVERRGSEFVCVQGSKPRFTGGNTGIPWGTFGVWCEPYDAATARLVLSK